MNYTHKDYDSYLPKWKRIRTFAEGSDEVKTAGTTYLPQPSGMDTDDYNGYKTRALYVNILDRTISAYLGLIFRKDPVIEQNGLDAIMEDATLEGTSFYQFMREAVKETIAPSRLGIMIDYPVSSTEGLMAADVEKIGIRPYMRMYKAENILYWKLGKNPQTAQYQCNELLLMEIIDKAEGKYSWESKENEQFRHIKVTNSGTIVEILVKNDKKDDFIVQSAQYILIRGNPVFEIPFVFVNAYNLNPNPEKPLLIDLVDVSQSHYITMADLENGRHWVGCPTPWIAGYSKKKGEVLKIGSSEAWIFESPQASCGILGLKSGDIGGLEEAAKSKLEIMAYLGTRALLTEPKGVESAETALIHRAGESNCLSNVAETCSEALTKALNWCARWLGLPEENTVILNTDFMPGKLDPAEIMAHLAAVQQGKEPLEYFFNIMKEGEVFVTEDTFEEFEGKLEKQTPEIFQGIGNGIDQRSNP